MKSNSLFAKVYALWAASRGWHIPVWIALHLVVVALSFLHPQFTVNSDLSTVLPDSNPNQIVSKAEQKMSANASAAFTVLVGNRDFDSARAAAQSFYTTMRQQASIDTLNFQINQNVMGDFQDYLYRYRYRLLPEESIALLEKGDIQALARDALQVIGSPLSVGALSRIDTDPYLLANRSLQAFLTSGVLKNMAISVRQDVLAAEHDGLWYVLLTGTIKSGGATETANNPVAAMRTVAEQAQLQFAGTDFVFSGIPFHTYDSSRKAQKEIELISTISTIAVILILVLVFFSLIPLGATLLTMLVGIGIGTLATFVCFREVHLFTIVFGTSLIGISIDYAVYYFAEWMNPAESHDGPSIIKRILPGISLGLLTTLVSYAAFCIAPFPLLRQMAVFSSVGLTSTWLTVVFLYPKLRGPTRIRTQFSLAAVSSVLGLYEKARTIPRVAKIGLVLALVVVASFGLARVHINNDLKSIYKVSPEMAAQEVKSAAILQHGATGAYFIVRGHTPDETLNREEELCSRLSELRQSGAVGAWSATSTLLPSRARQEKVYALSGSVLMPSMSAYMQSIGFTAADAKAVLDDYRRKATDFIDLDHYFALSVGQMSKTLWLGNVEGEWFSAVFLFNVHDKAALRHVAVEQPNVYFINKVEDVTAVLQDLSYIAIILLIAAYVFIFLGLWYLYGIGDALKISAIPVVASLLTCAALGFTSLPFNLFAIIGLILVPGIGIDYALFYREGGTHRSVTMLAVTLSLLSTILSFGMLSFSSLASVFGITVALGVTISFLLVPLIFARAQTQIAARGPEHRL